MTIALDAAAINLAVALSCGAVIGSERQVRQRMAGLRTNALVALGAAAFVIFSMLFPTEVSPTRVAAQVVSGIGFLGAGIIFRDGFNVHGLNTAATLWCSAAVGLIAGAGAPLFALMLTGMVVFINLGLRPLVKFLKRKTKAGLPVMRQFRILLTCTPSSEGEARSLILRTLTVGGLKLSEISADPVDGGIEISALFTGEGVTDSMLDLAMQRLAAEPGIGRLRWESLDEV
ncbi:MAG: MgtC/SapB family protein [Pseudomonadota bacterium]